MRVAEPAGGEKMETGVRRSQAPTKRRTTTGKLIQSAGKEIKPFREFLTKFSNDWSMTFAGVLAYNLLTAMLPIAIALVAILGLVLGATKSNNIIQQVSSVFPGLAGQQNAVALAIDQLSKQAGLLAIIAVALAIFGGSRLFITVEECLDIVYRVRPRPLIPQNLMAFGMFTLFIILIPIMVFASSAPSFILNFLGQNPILSTLPFVKSVVSNPVITYMAGIVGGLIAAFLLFEAIYFVVPNQRISWRNSWKGAVVAAVAMTVFLNLFPLYIQYFLKNYAGQIGFAVILLLFFYYFAVILMLGAEVNAFFFEGVHPLPNDLATFVSTMAGTLNRDIPESEDKVHQNPEPTVAKDRAHIAEARDQQEEIQEENQEQQRSLAARLLQKREHTQPTHPSQEAQNTQKQSRMWAILSVVVGSVMTVVIEMTQLHHRGK
jgi:YihY family inner membrane protein